jgi:CBS domain-containing protein
MQVKEIMSHSGVAIELHASFIQARLQMELDDCRWLVVADEGKIVGILDRETLDREYPSSRQDASKRSVKEIMRDLPGVCFEHESAADVAARMAQENTDGLLVVDRRNRYLGVVTRWDIENNPSVEGRYRGDQSDPASETRHGTEDIGRA